MSLSAGLRVKLAEWKIKSYQHFYYEMIENSVERGEINPQYTESNTHILVNIRRDTFKTDFYSTYRWGQTLIVL